MAPSPWRKSSRSGGEGGNCIEIQCKPGEVRDSKNPSVTLTVEIGPLLAAARAGRLNPA